MSRISTPVASATTATATAGVSTGAAASIDARPNGGTVALAAPASLMRKLALLALLAVVIAPEPAPAAAARTFNGPANIFGNWHTGRITQFKDDSLTVDLMAGGTQAVKFKDIWRIRQAFASDEPPGTTLIDLANNRLFVETPLSDVVANVGRKVPLTKLTAPNGEGIYIAAAKITGISNALPELHNPLSKSVIETRDGIQQVVESADTARQIIALAHGAQ